MRYFVFFFLIVNTTLNAQQHIVLKGNVIDAKTHEALPAVSVTLLHHAVGTICNAQGDFDLYLSDQHLTDTLQLSMIGYYSFKVALRKIDPHRPLSVSLKPSILYLNEIVVEDTLTAEVIGKRVIDNLQKNYAVKPFSIEGFYREVQQSDGEYVSLVEAAITIYNEARHRPIKVRVDQFRKSKGFTHPSNIFWDSQNLLLHLLQQNYVTNGIGGLKKRKGKFTRHADTSIDGEKVYVLSDGGNGFWPGIIYVRADNYAIIRAEEDFQKERDGEKSWAVEYSPLLRSKPRLKRLIVNYELFEGRYYTKSTYIKADMDYVNKLDGSLFQNFVIEQQFVATSINVNPDESMAKLKPLLMDESLEKLPFHYDPDFWKNYNMIKETPLDEKIKSDLEKKGKLEEQYEKN